MSRVFLSYARGDDEPFVRRLYDDLTAAGFTVWFDRESLMSRGTTFHQEVKDAIRTEVDRWRISPAPDCGPGIAVAKTLAPPTRLPFAPSMPAHLGGAY